MSNLGHNVSTCRLIELYRMMRRIRAFEIEAEKASLDGKVGGAVHLSIGQEAVAAGVCKNLRSTDLITTTHRGHGHCIAKGTDPNGMMLELFGRSGGTSGGKGGSMHIADFGVGMLGANGVVAAGISISVGAAHGAKIKGDDLIVASFFGDGAINRGPFLEGLNWASIFNLPVIFICELNAFASTTRTEAVTAGGGPVERAQGIGVRACAVDGNDVEAVDALIANLIPKIRNNGGPFLVAATTYRLKGHTSTDQAAYRDASEVGERWLQDPILRCEKRLKGLGVTEETIEDITRSAETEMNTASTIANNAAYPRPEDAFTDVQDFGAPTRAKFHE